MVLYNLLILANSLIAFQGFVFTVVYFAIQWLGRPQSMEFIRRWSIKSKAAATGGQLTVPDIRSNAEKKSQQPSAHSTHENNESEVGESFNFNIFDGSPDPDSPWARFIDQDYDGANDDGDEWNNDEDLQGTL